MKKKILYLVMLLAVLVMPLGVVDAKTTKKASKKTTTTTPVAASGENKPVNVYIFYGSTCGYCARLHQYMATLEKDSSINYMFNIVDYEVWADQTNSDLMFKVGEYFNKTIEGVPFTVIGDKYVDGYAESLNNDFVNYIKTAYEKQTKDVVASIGKGNVLKYNVEDPSQAATSIKDSGTSTTAAYIILGVTVVIVLLIVFGKSKNDKFVEEDEEDEDDSETEDDDDEEEDDEEEDDEDEDDEDDEDDSEDDEDDDDDEVDEDDEDDDEDEDDEEESREVVKNNKKVDNKVKATNGKSTKKTNKSTTTKKTNTKKK